MKKKILIGSIISIAILIAISFNSAVGYINVESNVKDSPLINIRINRAKGEEIKNISYKYITNDITILFPERNNREVLIQNVIYNIRSMTDETFSKFIDSFVNAIQKSMNNNDVSSVEIKNALYQVRYSIETTSIIDSDNNRINKLNIGIFKYILFLILLPILIAGGLFYWCFEPFETVITPVPTSCCHPITIGKLL